MSPTNPLYSSGSGSNSLLDEEEKEERWAMVTRDAAESLELLCSSSLPVVQLGAEVCWGLKLEEASGIDDKEKNGGLDPKCGLSAHSADQAADSSCGFSDLDHRSHWSELHDAYSCRSLVLFRKMAYKIAEQSLSSQPRYTGTCQVISDTTWRKSDTFDGGFWRQGWEEKKIRETPADIGYFDGSDEDVRRWLILCHSDAMLIQRVHSVRLDIFLRLAVIQQFHERLSGCVERERRARRAAIGPPACYRVGSVEVMHVFLEFAVEATTAVPVPTLNLREGFRRE
ncbi:hypothetical protein C8F01DRAFT_1339012 [Mycena amicta]|nr:hypothetical protein C8F01DRAFT_1339012 [Mycena amicta]